MRRYFFTDIFNHGPSLSYADPRIGNIHRFLYMDCQFEPCIFRSYKSEETLTLIIDLPARDIEYIGTLPLPAITRIHWLLYLALPAEYDTLIINPQPFALTRYGGTLQKAEDFGVYTVAARCIDANPDIPWSNLYTDVMTRTRKELGIKEPVC